MTADSKNAGAKATEPELVITRIIDAPRELVFKAWTEPERVKRWWGPETFTCPACKIDLRPGGKYRICMRSPEGRDYWSAGEYREIVVPERIVVTDYFSDEHGNKVSPTTHGLSEEWPAEMLMTITFEEHGGKTKLTVHQSVSESLAKRFQAVEGWSTMLDKLEAYVAKP
jgi:uncharacterized protein YndB with AHSA1/START domain